MVDMTAVNGERGRIPLSADRLHFRNVKPIPYSHRRHIGDIRPCYVMNVDQIPSSFGHSVG